MVYLATVYKPTLNKIKKKKKNLKSYGHWLETSQSANRNLVPNPNTKNHLLSLSELADFENKHFWHARGKDVFGYFAHVHELVSKIVVFKVQY